ncbi:MAG: PorV/PorQ family protein [Ignavibacteria bacterium]|nr:PorV/PorQ family protein [Ignavibacteria bacterium]
MRRSGIVLVLIATLFIGKVSVYAQGEAGLAFLQLAPDSRFSGLGESGAGLADNSSAIFWNPAGAAFLNGTEVSFTHSNWLPQFKLDLFYEYLTFRMYSPDIDANLLGSVTYMNYGEFVRTGETSSDPLGVFRSYDMALTLGIAKKVSMDWGVGFNFRLIHSRLADQGAGNEKGSGVATTVSFDLAAMYRPSNEFSVGVNLSNMGPKVFYIDKDQADPIPTNFRLGFAYVIFADEFNSLTATLDFSKLLVVKQDSTHSDSWYKAIFTAWTNKPFKEELRDIVTSGGLEYWYGIPGDFLFSARVGMFYEDPDYGNRKFMTLGAGVRYDMYGFDFSYITTSMFKGMENHPLADTLRFTISLAWDTVSDAIRGLPRGL